MITLGKINEVEYGFDYTDQYVFGKVMKHKQDVMGKTDGVEYLKSKKGDLYIKPEKYPATIEGCLDVFLDMWVGNKVKHSKGGFAELADIRDQFNQIKKDIIQLIRG